MEGRWTIYPAWPVGSSKATVEGPTRAEKVPVVPCDEAAIERGAREVRGPGMTEDRARAIAARVLRAAGETA